MRSIGERLGWTAATLAAGFAVGACGSAGEGTGAHAGLDAGLQRDLQLAAAASVELAGAQGLPRTRFVSTVEGAPAAQGRETTRADRRGTVRHRAATTGVRRVADVHAAPAVDDAPASAVAMVEAPAAITGDDDAAAPTRDEAPAPAPEPERTVAGGAGDGDGGARGEGEGTQRGGRRGGWIGVVLRGGGDGDHCERDLPGGRRGGGMVNRRFPGGGWGGPIAGLPGGVIARTPWPR